MEDTRERDLQVQRQVTSGTTLRVINGGADYMLDANHVCNTGPWTHVTLGDAAPSLSPGATAT
jgi:hypothetical protein